MINDVNNLCNLREKEKIYYFYICVLKIFVFLQSEKIGFGM